MVIIGLPALPTRQPRTIVPRLRGAAAAGSDVKPRQHHPRQNFLPLKWAGLLDLISLAADLQIPVRSIRARRVGDRQPAAARFGRWLLPAALILPGVDILQRRGLLAAAG